MIITENNLVRINLYQMDQALGKETIIEKEISYEQLNDLINDIPNITKSSIGKMTLSITTKIISGHSTLYDWYDNRFTGL